MLNHYRSMVEVGSAALLVAFASSRADAGVNLLVNGSFEDDTNWTNTAAGYHELLPGATHMTGWTVVSNRIAWGGPANGNAIVAPDGGYFLDLTGFGTEDPFGGITQTIATTPGGLYHLSLVLFNTVDSAPISVLASAGATSNVLNASGGFDFVAGAASTAITVTGATGAFFIGLDQVQVTAVPSPASAGLITVLGAGVLSRRTRKAAK